MVTTLELQRRGLPYAVVVDGAATTASLQALDRQGLPYLVEVADGATMASRRALEARGLRYLVPVLVDATPASKASLTAQGLRYAVQVDADILPADRLVLQRQGLACYVEVDSSGNSVSAAAVGGAALLVGEANGFAADFTHPVDAERVAVKTAGSVVSSGLSFFTQSGTSSKWVYNAAGVLVNIPVGTLALDYDPVTHAARGLLVEPQATNYVLQSAVGRVGFEWAGNGATVTGGQSDPAGGSQAAQVVVTNVATGNSISKNISPLTPASYIGSMWLKGTAGQQIFFNINSDDAVSQALITFTGSWQRVTSQSNGSITGATIGCETYNRSGGAHLSAVTFQCWGAQIEAGTVATTSHIPTLAATVTRAGDTVKLAPASINYSATAGSWWIYLSLNAVGGGTTRVIGHTTGSHAPIYVPSATVFGLYDGNLVNKTITSVLGTNKVMVAFASGDRVITGNGLAPATDATAGTALLGPGAFIGFGGDPNGPGDNINGYIRQLRYLPRRPTNAELQAMTA